jgi:Ribosome-associated heat shock protein implicated in the recycling of the 50S subunit (S4 paralog)
VEDKLRVDKWLWAARFYKTRALAVDEINKGRVLVNGQVAKPARELKPGDVVTVRKNEPPIEVQVLGVSRIRGPAPVAATLYQETEESVIRRERAAEMRRLAPEPSLGYDEGRPTKRDRRLLAAIRGK